MKPNLSIGSFTKLSRYKNYRFAILYIVGIISILSSSQSLYSQGLLLPIDYAAFVFEDVNLNGGSTFNRIAVGGNVSVSNYNIGSGISTSGYPTLFAEGDLTMNQVQISNGDSLYGGSLSSSSVNYDPGFSSLPVSASNPAPFDMSENQVFYQGLSSDLGNLANTGTIIAQPWALQLSGSQSGLNVFNVDQSDLFDASGNSIGMQLSAPTGSTVLINISGLTFNWNGWTNFGGFDSSNILFNFSDATSIEFGNIPTGSFLAATASLRGRGSLTNQAIVAGLDLTNVSINGGTFLGTIPVPEPSTYALVFGLIALGSVVTKRSIRKKNS